MPHIDDEKLKLVRKELITKSRRFAKRVALQIEQDREMMRLRQQYQAAAALERTETTSRQ